MVRVLDIVILTPYWNNAGTAEAMVVADGLGKRVPQWKNTARAGLPLLRRQVVDKCLLIAITLRLDSLIVVQTLLR